MNVIRFEPRDCQRIRAYLDSYINNELLVETMHDVLRHLEDCRDCTEALAERQHLKAPTALLSIFDLSGPVNKCNNFRPAGCHPSRC